MKEKDTPLALVRLWAKMENVIVYPVKKFNRKNTRALKIALRPEGDHVIRNIPAFNAITNLLPIKSKKLL